MNRPPLLDALVGDAEIEACFSDTADLNAMLRIESALAGAEAACGLIPVEAASDIAAACAAFRPDWDALAAGLARDGVVVPEFVCQLRATVGAPHATHVHHGATSQDIVDTSLMLRLKTVAGLLDHRLADVLAALTALAARDGGMILMAHTRMQRALPFHATSKIESWTAPLERHRARLAELGPRLFVLQLGGPVGTRAEFGERGDVVAAAMADRLGLGAAPCWHTQRDRIAEFGAVLSLISGGLGKLGQDVALMAQNEIGAVMLAGGGASSSMPHKQNPVLAEVLVTLARFNAGLLGTLHQALVHENERSGSAWTLEWLVLPRMVVTTGAALRKARDLLAGLRFTAR